jgi:mono/diheme cytochrome c family protein
VRVRLTNVILTLGALAAGGILVATIVLYAGFYNVAATHQHLAPTYWLLHIGLRESIERQARHIVQPLDSAGEASLERGRMVYGTHCVQCHGAPGVPPGPFALGLTPLPKNLAPAARERSPAELYWVIRNGIKMTGMPAWEFRLSERDLWAVTAFVQQLPFISPQEYAARDAGDAAHQQAATTADAPPGSGDPQRGKMAIRQYACTTCHLVPGIVGPHAPVGPPLERIGTREYIAGMLPNTAENMLRWLKHPQEVNPRTAMPDLGVTERDARDMAAYLYTLR